MTRQDTQILKGISILLMLFLHLFNKPDNVDLCRTFLYVGNTPLLSYLVRAANPVPFFLILGGYGMYCVWRTGDKHRWSRIFLLLCYYWLTLLIFVPIGHIVKPDIYPGSWSDVISNVTSFHTTYNYELWFLFPYVCLSIISPYIFTVCERVRVRYVLGISFAMSLITSFIISRLGTQYLYGNMWLYNPVLVINFLFAFLLGAMAARLNFFEHDILKLGKPVLYVPMILLLITLRCLVATSAVHTVYAFMFLYLFLRIPHTCLGTRILGELGKKSMGMWMIHSWFCYYLFHDWIYGFRYPVVIMAVLSAVSYVSATLVGMIINAGKKLLS